MFTNLNLKTRVFAREPGVVRGTRDGVCAPLPRGKAAAQRVCGAVLGAEPGGPCSQRVGKPAPALPLHAGLLDATESCLFFLVVSS